MNEYVHVRPPILAIARNLGTIRVNGHNTGSQLAKRLVVSTTSYFVQIHPMMIPAKVQTGNTFISDLV